MVHGVFSRGCGLAAIACWVLAAAPSVQADDVTEGIDAARIKARAGDAEEALRILDALIEGHEGDARILYLKFCEGKELRVRNVYLKGKE